MRAQDGLEKAHVGAQFWVKTSPASLPEATDQEHPRLSSGRPSLGRIAAYTRRDPGTVRGR